MADLSARWLYWESLWVPLMFPTSIDWLTKLRRAIVWEQWMASNDG